MNYLIRKIIRPEFFVIALLLINSCSNTTILSPVPTNAYHSEVLILAEPNPALIYIDDQYLGKTPIKTELWYFDSNVINIKAEPTVAYEQYPQNIFLTIPQIPNRLTFFMNHKPKVKLSDSPPPPEIPLADIKKSLPEKKPHEDIDEQKPITLKSTAFRNFFRPLQDKVTEIEIPIILPSIFFDYDRAIIKEQDVPDLNRVVKILKKHPEYYMSIHGYAAETGEIEYNLQLSLRRANVVQDYLISKGIDKNRLNAFAHGQRSTISEHGIELEFSKNRTVEFRVYEQSIESKTETEVGPDKPAIDDSIPEKIETDSLQIIPIEIDTTNLHEKLPEEIPASEPEDENEEKPNEDKD